MTEKEDQQTKDYYEGTIQERTINKNFIFYMFNDYITAQSNRTEVNEINEDISKDKLLSFYTHVPLKEEAIPISDGISLEKKLARHIDINSDNFISPSNNRISVFISSIEKIFKYYQRKLFYENYCTETKENKENLVYELIQKINEILYKNEQCDLQLDIENNTKKILIFVFILKQIAHYYPFLLYENEGIFIRCFNLIKRFKSYPEPIGLIGSQLSSMMYDEAYLPGVSLLNTMINTFDILSNEAQSNEITIDKYNSYFFLYKDEALFDISQLNSVTKKRDTIKISNLITYILILFNIVDPTIQSRPERFDYIYHLYTSINQKSSMIAKLRSMIKLIKDSYKYDRRVLINHISEFNKELIEKDESIIHTQPQNRYSYIELIELFKYLKPIIVKKTITNDYLISNFLDELKDITHRIKVILYEDNIEDFIYSLRNYEELIHKVEVYLLPTPGTTDNKFSSFLSNRDVLYNNLIYEPFSLIDKDKEQSIPHLKSMKSFLHLYLIDSDHSLPLYYYKESTSSREHIVFESSIVLNNISRNDNIIIQNEYIFEIYIKDKLTSTFYSTFDSIEIITKNILYTDGYEYEKAEIEVNKTDMLLCILSQDKYVPCDKIIIKHTNNEEKMSFTNILGQTESVSRFCLEGLYKNSSQLHLSIKTFC